MRHRRSLRSRVRWGSAVLCLLLLVGAGQPASTPMPLFRGNLARTGWVEKGPQPPLALRWKFKTRSGVEEIESFPGVDDGLSAATAANGLVYVGGHDGWVYALDARTGGKKWEYATRGRINSTPACDGKLLYVGSRDNHFYALDAKSGAPAWKYRSGVRMFHDIQYGGIRCSPAVSGDVVFTGGCDGRVRALDRRTGVPRWTFDTLAAGCYSSPALVDGTVYVGSDGVSKSHLFALDAKTGKVRWKFAAPTQIYSTPAVVDGVVYFHARNDHVYAVRARDGRLVWKTPAPCPQDDVSLYADISKSSPAVARSSVVVGIGKALVALDRRSGKVLWRAPTAGKVDSSPLVVGQTVYVGSDDKNVYGFDLASGRRTWSFTTGGKVSVSPSVGEGLLLVGSNDGYLYAFGEKGARAARS